MNIMNTWKFLCKITAFTKHQRTYTREKFLEYILHRQSHLECSPHCRSENSIQQRNSIKIMDTRNTLCIQSLENSHCRRTLGM